MLTIWKKSFGPGAIRTEAFPVGADVLSCGMQNGQIAIWFLCDPTGVTEGRTVVICGTGWEADGKAEETLRNGQFIGTVNAGSEAVPLMFHVFVGDAA